MPLPLTGLQPGTIAPAQPTEGAQSVRRALAILRAVATAQERGARLIDIVNATDLNRPTVHRILKVLAEESAVEQDPLTRRYFAGPEIALLGLARTASFPVRALADPYLRQLCDQVGDTVFLSVRHGLDSIGIDRKTGHYPIQVLSIDIGARRPLGVGVSGVAILACLPPEEAAQVMQANAKRLALERLSVQALAARVEAARDLGYAYAAAGVVPGTSAVAVPVRLPCGKALAAISIAAMADRLQARPLESTVRLMTAQADSIVLRYLDVQRLRHSGGAGQGGAAGRATVPAAS